MNDHPRSEVERSETKYGDQLEGKQWSEGRQDEGAEEEAWTSAGAVSLEIIHLFDPSQDHGFGRRKYELHVNPPEEDQEEWVVLYATTHRWKGNYWRKSGEEDWQDLPGIVKAKAADVLPVDTPSDLDPGIRLVDDGGESA